MYNKHCIVYTGRIHTDILGKSEGSHRLHFCDWLFSNKKKQAIFSPNNCELSLSLYVTFIPTIYAPLWV